MTGGCEDDLYPFLHSHPDELRGISPHERNVDTERLRCPALRFADVLAKQVRAHRSRTDQTKSARLRNCNGELVARRPHHPRLNDRIPYAEQPRDAGVQPGSGLGPRASVSAPVRPSNGRDGRSATGGDRSRDRTGSGTQPRSRGPGGGPDPAAGDSSLMVNVALSCSIPAQG